MFGIGVSHHFHARQLLRRWNSTLTPQLCFSGDFTNRVIPEPKLSSIARAIDYEARHPGPSLLFNVASGVPCLRSSTLVLHRARDDREL